MLQQHKWWNWMEELFILCREEGHLPLNGCQNLISSVYIILCSLVHPNTIVCCSLWFACEKGTVFLWHLMYLSNKLSLNVQNLKSNLQFNHRCAGTGHGCSEASAQWTACVCWLKCKTGGQFTNASFTASLKTNITPSRNNNVGSSMLCSWQGITEAEWSWVLLLRRKWIAAAQTAVASSSLTDPFLSSHFTFYSAWELLSTLKRFLLELLSAPLIHSQNAGTGCAINILPFAVITAYCRNLLYLLLLQEALNAPKCTTSMVLVVKCYYCSQLQLMHSMS